MLFDDHVFVLIALMDCTMVNLHFRPTFLKTAPQNRQVLQTNPLLQLGSCINWFSCINRAFFVLFRLKVERCPDRHCFTEVTITAPPFFAQPPRVALLNGLWPMAVSNTRTCLFGRPDAIGMV